MKNNCGFTLIEVLISVALIAVIMVLIWQTTSQSIKGKQMAEKRYQNYHEIRVTLEKLAQDISMAFLLRGESQLGKKQGAPRIKTVFKGDDNELSFPSLAHLRLFRNVQASEACEIGYKLERDEEDSNGLVLMRRESPFIDDKPEEGGVWIDLIHKVKRLEFQYYDGKKFEWQSSWNSENTEAGGLPRAVKIILTIENFKNPKEEMVFQTTTFIELNKYAIEF